MNWRERIQALIDRLLGKLPPLPPIDPPPTVPPPSGNVQAQLLALHNAERAKAGLSVLRNDARLELAAQQHANHMARTGTLSHALDGKWPWDRAREQGYVGSVGENIAWNQRTPQEAVQDWMGSSGHRANILNAVYQDAGFGVADSAKGKYWCSVFGSVSRTTGLSLETSCPPGIKAGRNANG